MVTSDGLAESRVAIVTGGSRGIGHATVLHLAEIGYSVVVNYVHDQATAESVVERVLERRGAAVAIRADVSDELDVERLFETTIDAFGAVHAVVHSVRGQVAPAPVTELALDDLDGMVRTGSRAAFVVIREAARHVRDGGAIVSLLGSVTSSTLPAYSGYAASSAMTAELCRTIAPELRERDITINGVSLDVDEPCSPPWVAEVIAELLTHEDRGVTGRVINLEPRGST